jgi:osmotically-inducible protein OsmY
MSRQLDVQSIDGLSTDRLTELEEHVRCRLSGRVRDIQLTVRDGGLVLRGHAHSYYAKQLAQQVVMEVARVPILVNEIEVT